MRKNIWMGLAEAFAPAATRHKLLERLHAWRACGDSAALVVINKIEGRTSRDIGTLLAVHADGAVAGSISGGCFDAAVVAEAKAVLAEGKTRLLRLGAGSPWIDVKLPCGGGMELLILPNPDVAMLARAVEAIAQREACTLELDRGDGSCFSLAVEPRLRLLVAGNGGEVLALAALARAVDAEVVALSPDAALLDTLDETVGRLLLKTPESLDNLVFDQWTAVATFFHDHDWEPPLLARALASDAYFVGAMGSLATHEARCAALAERGVAAEDVARIASPLGLFSPARDPQALAISALAQILAERR
jgi:xanthine dehydrogenase accessory factor